MLRQVIKYIKDDEFKMYIYHNQVDIINYNSLVTVIDNLISIKYNNDNLIIIKGNKLSIKKMLESEILISGVIEIIEFK